MKIKCFFLLLVLSGLLCVCSEQYRGGKKFVGQSMAQINLKEYFAYVDIIPMKMKNQDLIGSIDKIMEIDSSYVILDKRQQSLFSFDRFGNHMETLSKYGEGPCDYLNIYDFDVDEKKRKIYLLCFPKKIMVFDFSFRQDTIIKLDKDYQRIAVDDSCIYLYEGTRNLYLKTKEDSPRLVHSVGEMKKLYLGNEPVFHRVDNEVLYVPHGSASVYRIENDKVQERCILDYENKELAEEKMCDNSNVSMDGFARYTPPRISHIYKLDSLYHIHYTYQLLMRKCVIDIRKQTMLEDGILVFEGRIPQMGNSVSMLSWDFCSDSGIQIPSELKVNYVSSFSEEDDMAFIKYMVK